MKRISELFQATRRLPVALLLAASVGMVAIDAQASESGAGSPRDSRCETRDTCTNLMAPAADGVVEARAARPHLVS